MVRNPNWGGARGNRSALARPTVKRVELDDDVATAVREGCRVRYGTATKADVTQYINDMLRAALAPKEHPMTRTFRLTPIHPDDISATDLRGVKGAGTHEAYTVTIYDATGTRPAPEAAEALWLPGEGRLGIAWGADATWGDAKSVEAGIEMWLNDGEAWALAN